MNRIHAQFPARNTDKDMAPSPHAPVGRLQPTRQFPKPILAALALALVLSACSDDDSDTDSTTTTTIGDPSTTIEAPRTEQAAIWPTADVVFETPEAAAEDFVRNALGVPPVLGEFQQGDTRSGEIEVFSPGEGDTSTRIFRGLLLLRQLGPENGWFILGAVNDNASITSPESRAEVPAGPLLIEGVGRGFEATVIVTAFIAGDAGIQLDEAIAQGGAFETPKPFEVTLDLSAASPGDVVTLLVRGGTGLETDPGEFGAIPVIIAG